MLKRMLPAFLLLFSACEGLPPPDGSDGEVRISTYINRDPIATNLSILEWRAIDATHVFILDRNRELWYGDGVNFNPVQTKVGWFEVAPQSPGNANSPAIWIKDMSNNLYQWQLGWWPQQVQEEPIAYNVGLFKVSADGYPYWMQGTNLYGGYNRALIDGNVSSFWPASGYWIFDIGSDGKVWEWGTNGGGQPWTRTYMDSNGIAAEPGCFDDPTGQCNSYVLGSDRKLWGESNVFGGHGPNYVDANVLTFQASSRWFVFVQGTDRNLWREDVQDGRRDYVDGNVYLYQQAGNDTVWVQGYDGKLWREHLSTTLP
jgi:hypothetical protein